MLNSSQSPSVSSVNETTLQGINISHLGKRKIIFKMPFLRDMLVPWRVTPWKSSRPNKVAGLLHDPCFQDSRSLPRGKVWLTWTSWGQHTVDGAEIRITTWDGAHPVTFRIQSSLQRSTNQAIEVGPWDPINQGGVHKRSTRSHTE